MTPTYVHEALLKIAFRLCGRGGGCVVCGQEVGELLILGFISCHTRQKTTPPELQSLWHSSLAVSQSLRLARVNLTCKCHYLRQTDWPTHVDTASSFSSSTLVGKNALLEPHLCHICVALQTTKDCKAHFSVDKHASLSWKGLCSLEEANCKTSLYSIPPTAK